MHTSVAAVVADHLERRSAFEADPARPLDGRGHPGDVGGEVVGHRGRAAGVLEVSPAGGAQGAAAALGEHHPYPPRHLQLVEIPDLVGGGVAGAVLGARVRRQPARPREFVAAVAQHPPERHQVLVEIVHGLEQRRRLREQDREGPGERFDVVPVRRQQACDLLGQAGLAAVVRERRQDPGRVPTHRTHSVRAPAHRCRPIARRLLPACW
jgi:hypothetical protein